jgi:UDP-N-acetylglucosamine 2-epimerase (non-hydrolysing)/GDP/UDP-N,N'-diacetylbacillosamine 2-epimerase (hydrolysing)
MIGNSSSGFYEAPTLQKAFVNIGDRQKGRLKANSIIDCKPDVESIIKAVTAAYQLDCSKTVNPYGKGDSAKQIALVIKSLPYSKQRLLQKKWIHNVS